MSVSKNSSDGSITIEAITVDGISFDLPPWISESDFREGLKSGDDDNPLSSLVSCTFDEWDTDEDYDGNVIPLAIFAVEWFIPFKAVRELVCDFFTPDGDSLVVEITDTGVKVSHKVYEYRDTNDIQVLVLPEDLSNLEYPGSGEWSREVFDEVKENFEESVKQATEWGGYFEKFTTPSGESHFVLVKVHED